MKWRKEVQACFKTVSAIIDDGLSMPALDTLEPNTRAIYLSFAGLLTGHALGLISAEYERLQAEIDADKKLAARTERKAKRDATRMEAIDAACSIADVARMVLLPPEPTPNRDGNAGGGGI